MSEPGGEHADKALRYQTALTRCRDLMLVAERFEQFGRDDIAGAPAEIGGLGGQPHERPWPTRSSAS